MLSVLVQAHGLPDDLNTTVLWSFNATTLSSDSEHNWSNMTTSGDNFIPGQDGIADTALAFDTGNFYKISLNNVNPINNSQNYTIEYVFFCNATVNKEQISVLEHGTGDLSLINIEDSNSTMRIITRDDNGGSDQLDRFDGAIAMDDGNWHYVAITRNILADNWTVYLDGVINHSTATMNQDNEIWDEGEWWLGAYSDAGTDKAEVCGISELRISNETKTLSEIQALNTSLYQSSSSSATLSNPTNGQTNVNDSISGNLTANLTVDLSGPGGETAVIEFWWGINSSFINSTNITTGQSATTIITGSQSQNVSWFITVVEEDSTNTTSSNWTFKFYETPTTTSFIFWPDTQIMVDEDFTGCEGGGCGNGDPQMVMMMANYTCEMYNNDSIEFMIHVGDMVNNGNKAGSAEEWTNIENALNVVENCYGGVPYFIVPGNHDYDSDPPSSRAMTKYNSTFPLSNISDEVWYGDSYDGATRVNYYGYIADSNRNFLIMNLETCPRSEVLDWMTEVFDNHSDYYVIINTHMSTGAEGNDDGVELMNQSSSDDCTQYSAFQNDNNGIDIWYNHTAAYGNNILTVTSGHFLSGDPRRPFGHMFTNDNDSNSTMWTYFNPAHTDTFGSDGGNGYLVEVSYHWSIDEVEQWVWSPWLNQTQANYTGRPQHNFNYSMTNLTSLSPPTTTFNATAISDNDIPILTFNMTVNNSLIYPTTNGTVFASLLGSNTLTFDSNNFNSSTYTNWDTSSNITAYLLFNLTVSNSINDTTPYVNNNITMWCNWTYTDEDYNQDNNISYVLINNNDSLTWLRESVNTTNHTFTINDTEFLDNVSYYCSVETIYGTNTSSTSSIAHDVIDNIFYFYSYGADTLLLSSINYTFWTSSLLNTVSNPAQRLASSFFNSSTLSRNETIQIDDNLQGHQTDNFTSWMNVSTEIYNFTLDPSQINFLFWQNGTAMNSSGWIADSQANTVGFNNTTYAAIQTNFSLGPVHMRFGLLDGENHTQYYEWINDYETNITENLEILSIGDWSAYIRVLDQNNDPIPEAIVRADMAYHSNATWTNGATMGQRLTDDGGYTFFIADSPTDVLFRASKQGYTTEGHLITIGDESRTKDDPIIIYLDESEFNNTPFVDINYPNPIRTKEDDIETYVTAVGHYNVSFTTYYRNGSFDPNRKYCLYTYYGVWDCELIEGEDFSNTTNDSIIISYFIDDINTTMKTIVKDPLDTSRFTSSSGLPILNATFLAIMIILLTSAITVSTKNMGAGIMAFGASSVIAAFINPVFAWLVAIFVLYVGGRVLYRAQRT